MPYSSESGKSYIRNIVCRVKHDRMLDIGCGSGTYAKMFPDAHWTGVEVWEPYVEEFKLKDLYQQLILADVTDVKLKELGHFDVAILGDVLEHMEKDKAKFLLGFIKSIADTVIVSIPIGHYPQDEYNGNPYEKHVTDNWTDEDFRATFGEPTVGYIENEIGVYCWSTQKVRPKICVYTITKNEEQFIARWAASAKDADLLLIADTGSTDDTVKVAKENGVVAHEICITPWRFDHARNANIALIPKDMDICICMDADEVLEPGWREEIERVWTPETTRLGYYFDWGCGIKFRYEKIHARYGYFWHHPCHEYPVPDKRIKEVWAETPKLLVSHHPDPTKSRGQYMDLLELSVKEDPKCPRNAFYYGRELSFHRRWNDAIVALKRYLDLPDALWPNERCYAMRVMAECYAELGNAVEAEIWFNKSASEAPNTREPWCQLALHLYRQERWAECYAASMRAISITNRELVYTCDPAVWGHWAHDLASVSAWQMGMKEVAYEQAKIAMDITPGEQRLKSNYEWIRNAILNDPAHKPIPNIVHFIYFMGPKSRDFSYINYLAVKAAKEVQKPDKIYFYYNEEPGHNPHWEAIKPYVEMVQVAPQEDFGGVSLQGYPQYQSDVMRLQKLYDLGGIYLDTDCLMVRPFGDLLNHDCVMAGDPDNLNPADENALPSMAGHCILARPKSKFIEIWLNRLAYGLKKDIWAWHNVCLPMEIYQERPDLLTMLEMKSFMPFGFRDYSILSPDEIDSALDHICGSYVVHLWETIWQNELQLVDAKYLAETDNAFTRLFKELGDFT